MADLVQYVIGGLVVGSIYGLVDGAIGGCVFSWLYNLLSGGKAAD